MVDGGGTWSVKYNSPFRKTDIITEEIELLSVVDSATNWVEFTVLPNDSSQTPAIALDKQWLCRYPRPPIYGHHDGTEQTGWDFQEMLAFYGIIPEPMTFKNRMAQSLVEWIQAPFAKALGTKIFKRDYFKGELDHLLQSVA